jgi:N-methylhydantoinase A
MKTKVCIDVGGTFTDAAVADEEERIHVFKSLSTWPDYIDGIIDVLRVVSEHYGEPLNKFLQSCFFIGHGTTIATNAIITGNVAKVGLICTRGFRDILSFREGGKNNLFDYMVDYPEPYVPRYLTLPVTERINAEGGVDIPVDEEDVRQILRRFKKWNVKAIAVSLLFSFMNPVHEERIAEIASEEYPEVPCVLSHHVNPCIREYRRTVSTAIDASLRPLVSKYISDLEGRLRKIGYQGRLFMFTSSGGVMTARELVETPLYIIDSGPALAPVAGKVFANKEGSTDNVITMDMGGTSFDVGCITGGEIATSRENRIGNELPGISKVDTKSVGAGGGSIAWVDVAGLIHVGPQSAGSVPGPACYMRGGEFPTVTDANFLLGYLDADYFLGGRMKIDKKRAEEAVQKEVGSKLKLDALEAAYTIYSTVNANMVTAIRDVTIWQGIDPRGYLVVAGGGACGLHLVPLISELEIKKAVVPKTAGALSAVGGIFAVLTAEYSISYYTETNGFNYTGVNKVLDALREKASLFFDRSGIPVEERELEFIVEARYPYQIWELPVSLKDISLDHEDGVAKMVERFHEVHERVFSIKEPGVYIECISWKVKATGRGTAGETKLRVSEFPEKKPSSKALLDKRKAYFREMGGMVEVPAYVGNELRYGNEILGPAIIEEPTTTVVLFPRSKATVTRFGSYLIEL